MNQKILVLALVACSFLINSCKDSASEPEPDNIPSVKIGNQVWMSKNLDVGHYRNGDSIPEIRDSAQWVNAKEGAWCYYNNDPALGAIYGKLYNWYAVNDPRGLAPKGWHVPNDAEWDTLTYFTGGYEYAGIKLKATGTIEDGTGLWGAPNEGATNESGFTALPGGRRADSFYSLGYFGNWQSSTEESATLASYKKLISSNASFPKGVLSKYVGFSVRCVKD